MVAGVCGGLADYFEVEPVLIRAAFVAMLFYNGFGLLLYIILTIIIPEEPGRKVEVDRGAKLKEFASDLGDQAQTLASEIKSNRGWMSDRKNILAVIIIAIGVLALVNQVVPWPWFQVKFLWAIILIVIGVFIIFKKS